MRAAMISLFLIALAGCTGTATPDTALPARQEAICRDAIAAHIGRPAAEVTPRWLSRSGTIATIETIDGGRRHLCRVDDQGRLLGYTHPRD